MSKYASHELVYYIIMHKAKATHNFVLYQMSFAPIHIREFRYRSFPIQGPKLERALSLSCFVIKFMVDDCCRHQNFYRVRNRSIRFFSWT